jgi:hypothetical protein
VFAVPQDSRIEKKYFQAPRKILLQIQRLDRRKEMWDSPFATNNLWEFFKENSQILQDRVIMCEKP